MDITLINILAAVGGLSGLAALGNMFLNWYRSRGKSALTQAQTDQVRAETSTIIIRQLRNRMKELEEMVKRLDTLEGKVEVLENENKRFRKAIRKLVEQLRELGEEPNIHSVDVKDIAEEIPEED